MTRNTRPPAPVVALGSLTQQGARTGITCVNCSSDRVTRLSMSLTDGTAVEFTSCHRCEHKTWADAAGQLSVEEVLGRTRKPR